jgi:hypothetical protein
MIHTGDRRYLRDRRYVSIQLAGFILAWFILETGFL